MEIDGRAVGAADVNVTPEAAGLKAIAHGFAMVHGEEDHRKIELESPLYDARYAWCQHAVAKAKPLADHKGCP